MALLIIYTVDMNYLLEQGKIAIRVRKRLREFLNAQEQKNNFINDLIEKEYKTQQAAPKSAIEQYKESGK